MISIIDDVTSRIKTTTLDDILSMLCIFLFKSISTIYFGLHFVTVNTYSGLLFLLNEGFERTGRKRIIMDRTDEEPYLVRYYLFLKERDNFPFNIFIHKFLKSDPDDLHDHPWGFRTVILKGGYWEHTEEGKFWREPGFTQSVRPMHKHRVELKPNCTCWTLFIPYRRVREWGFYRNGEWIESEEYFKKRKQEKLENHKTGKKLHDFTLDSKLVNEEETTELVSEEVKKEQ